MKKVFIVEDDEIISSQVAKHLETWQMKAKVYSEDNNAELFIESDDYQAQMIHQLTGKQVLCVGTNKIYG